MAIDAAIEAVEKLPAGNVTPIKHGHIVLYGLTIKLELSL